MQMSDVHIGWIAGQGMSRVKDSVVFSFMHISGFYLACEKKLASDQIVDACLKAHVNTLSVPTPVYLWGKDSIPWEPFSAQHVGQDKSLIVSAFALVFSLLLRKWAFTPWKLR